MSILGDVKGARHKREARVTEIFYSIQGEGVQTGVPMVFIRFSGCNLRCTRENAGFDCDTEFASGETLSYEQIFDTANEVCEKTAPYQVDWLLLTGGEPALWVTREFLEEAKARGWKVAIETNGTFSLPAPELFDWITVSPKSAEHTLRQRTANEVKYVRCFGQSIPRPSITAASYVISPAFQADGTLLASDAIWCADLVKKHPTWRLSVQSHKLLGLRWCWMPRHGSPGAMVARLIRSALL